jgi:hypothetical protein
MKNDSARSSESPEISYVALSLWAGAAGTFFVLGFITSFLPAISEGLASIALLLPLLILFSCGWGMLPAFAFALSLWISRRFWLRTPRAKAVQAALAMGLVLGAAAFVQNHRSPGWLSLLLPMASTLVPMALVGLFTRPLRNPRLCPGCGYDLFTQIHGRGDPRCPECGEPVSMIFRDGSDVSPATNQADHNSR